VVQELFEEEKKMKDLRWQEAKTIQEHRISIEDKWLMWEQEQKIMFCDVSTSYRLKSRHIRWLSQSVGGSIGSHNVGDGLGGNPSI
jgi:hypothetical protein